MRTEASRIVLLTRLQLRPIVREVVSGGAPAIYYDPHGSLHGPIFLLLVALLGRRRLEAWIDRCARWLRLPLRAVPHGQRVADYAPLQHTTAIDAARLLYDSWKDPRFDPQIALPEGALEGSEARSLYVKFIGVQAWQLIENIRVVRRLERAPLVVYLNARIWPSAFLGRLSRSEGVTLRDAGCRGAWLDTVLGALLLLRSVAATIVRWRPPEAPRPPRRYVAATECLDPATLSGRPAEPNYLLGDALSPADVLFYVQPDRRRFFGHADRAVPGSTVVDLARLPLSTRHVWFMMRAAALVLRWAWRNGTPLLTVREHVGYARKYTLLAALFDRFAVQVHIYNAYPQGRVAWRHDSGLITGVCRRHGVYSLSYQTRAHFGRAMEYCFDCYDEYCCWGEWWRHTYHDHMDVKHFSVIGDVFLDEHLSQTRRRRPATADAYRSIVVFPCDIHAEGDPSYLTLDYAVEFLAAVIKAADTLNGRASGPRFEIVVKPKHTAHVALLEQDQRLAAAVAASPTPLTCLQHGVHETIEAVARADYALALLPTTPGMDVLLTGVPSRYFNRLSFGDPFFDESPLIVRTVDEIVAFLSGERSLSPAFIDSLDPWRDGQARGRLTQVIVDAARHHRGTADSTAALLSA